MICRSPSELLDWLSNWMNLIVFSDAFNKTTYFKEGKGRYWFVISLFMQIAKFAECFIFWKVCIFFVGIPSARAHRYIEKLLHTMLVIVFFHKYAKKRRKITSQQCRLTVDRCFPDKSVSMFGVVCFFAVYINQFHLSNLVTWYISPFLVVFSKSSSLLLIKQRVW